MKHQFRHLVSFLALIAMLVSMVSVCVFPAAAAGAEDAEYQKLLNSAKVVNAQWANASQGDQISYEFRGNTVNERFNPTRHFESYATSETLLAALIPLANAIPQSASLSAKISLTPSPIIPTVAFSFKALIIDCF